MRFRDYVTDYGQSVGTRRRDLLSRPTTKGLGKEDGVPLESHVVSLVLYSWRSPMVSVKELKKKGRKSLWLFIEEIFLRFIPTIKGQLSFFLKKLFIKRL